MSSSFIAAGVNRPFVVDRVEPWLQFMEDCRFAVIGLSPQSQLLAAGAHEEPFPELERPAAISGWQMEWVTTSLEGWRVARFSATTLHQKTIQWHVFHKSE